ncbi:rhodanese-like domain-containing protein [Kocuria sp.]|uniref:rhodanese-like domain-containing protein n=1 Tax=Kocuria sp. TaxID=1871328 RepID=UPI0026DACCB9|nr:rhodanese-like domain-containing protein [Kocuria sp.]MDO4918810.1 rhodanese-like domain-containing protein [Kocuria sp.]
MTASPDVPEPRSLNLLRRVREHLDRLTPQEAHREQLAGARIVDVRTEIHRRDGPHIPGSLVIDLTVLPWRLDPDFEWSIPEAVTADQRWILVCRHGFATSLAAWNLRQMGLSRATDVVGGFEAWSAAGLPLTMDAPDVRP